MVSLDLSDMERDLSKWYWVVLTSPVDMFYQYNHPSYFEGSIFHHPQHKKRGIHVMEVSIDFSKRYLTKQFAPFLSSPYSIFDTYGFGGYNDNPY